MQMWWWQSLASQITTICWDTSLRIFIAISVGCNLLQSAALKRERGGGGGGNMVAHSLARHVRNIIDEMYWLEDSSPPAVDTLYQDFLHINEWTNSLFFKKKEKRKRKKKKSLFVLESLSLSLSLSPLSLCLFLIKFS